MANRGRRAPAPLELTFSAEPTRLAAVRRALRTWLACCEIGGEDAWTVLIAADEACANAIEHGHRGRAGGSVRLHASTIRDGVHLTISDNGRWRPVTSAPDNHRGRGLELMQGLMSQVHVETGDAGTVVDMRAHFARPGAPRPVSAV
ncbi:ATP-binding protein [Nocardia sp. NPDC049190]|uniref:ATP-binding protein n=1 Tax=Nocardia sp. NPDC049190 TaxID=3155650 RepID=UPI0033E2B82A